MLARRLSDTETMELLESKIVRINVLLLLPKNLLGRVVISHKSVLLYNIYFSWGSWIFQWAWHVLICHFSQVNFFLPHCKARKWWGLFSLSNINLKSRNCVNNSENANGMNLIKVNHCVLNPYIWGKQESNIELGNISIRFTHRFNFWGFIIKKSQINYFIILFTSQFLFFFWEHLSIYFLI